MNVECGWNEYYHLALAWGSLCMGLLINYSNKWSIGPAFLLASMMCSGFGRSKFKVLSAIACSTVLRMMIKVRRPERWMGKRGEGRSLTSFGRRWGDRGRFAVVASIEQWWKMEGGEAQSKILGLGGKKR